jgi:hypothetical protein
MASPLDSKALSMPLAPYDTYENRNPDSSEPPSGFPFGVFNGALLVDINERAELSSYHAS